jgi:hypothetical protein
MKKLLSVFVALTIISASFWSCSKGYLDINTPNPNAATSATPELVITNAMTTTALIQIANANITPILYVNGWMGYWASSGSYAPATDDIASYKETTEYGNNMWIYDYRNLEDYYYVEQSAEQQLKPFYTAMAKSMKSLVFQQLVDFFNNVPYSQAFQGTLIITPKYDNGQAVYDSLVLNCDSAVTLMQSPAAIGEASSDIMFGGDNASWIAFINTLKLRLLMRQSQVSSQQAYIQAEIAKITANGGGFLTTDAGVNPPYANNAGQQNPLWGFFRTLTGLPTSGGQADLYRAAQFSITALTSYNDPRLPFIYALNSSGVYAGSILGSSNNPPGGGASSLGPGLLQSVNQTAILISAAESYFLQAEAIVRGYLPGSTADAAAAYAAGVQASFNYLGAGDATAYLNQGNINTNFSLATTTQQQIAVIMRQAWIAYNGVTPIEAYDNYRRTGLPSDIPLTVSAYKAGNTVPVRSLYPVSEYTSNAANVNAQGTIDYFTSKVFWNQ